MLPIFLPRLVVAIILAAAGWLLSGAPALAATVPVNTSADENGTGSACSLREAVVAVNAGSNGTGGCVATGTYGTNDQITFAGGTDGTAILLTNGRIVITHSVQIIGNGAARTILDGQKGTATASGVLQVNSGIIVSISGLTIRNGSGSFGGGINNFAALTVTNSTVSGNLARDSGGGIHNDGGGTVTVTNSILSGNSADFGGGAIYNDIGGTVTVSNSTVSGNSAGSGGGISNELRGTLTITNSTLSRNSAGSGGGISNSNGALTVTDSTVSGNSATINGGGIDSASTTGITTDITNSTVSGNSARDGGGMYNRGALTVSNSTFSGNLATSDGGGMFSNGALTVTYSTLSGNAARGEGGGIYNSVVSSGVLLRAAVLDTGTSGANCVGSISSLGSNIADDTSCGLRGFGDLQVVSGVILLGPLADNGGPTRTHALLPGNPAINAVVGPCNSTGVSDGTALTVDQRGRPRPGGVRCDAGAYELSIGTLNFSAPTYAVGEGDGSATITVTRTGGFDGSVGATVRTAVAPADYTAPASVSFADGDASSKIVSISIINDPLKELNETLALTLDSPIGGATIGTQSTAVLTIFDDDSTPALSIANVSAPEGNTGQSTASFTATLSNPSTQQITVAYATTNGTATAGTDYMATSGTLTFAPGVTSQPIAVPILGDTVAEPDETFTVTLSAPTNATLGVSQALDLIQNDDGEAPRTLSIAGVSLPEGNSGTSTATFSVTRSGSLEQTATVQFATANGTATAGTDYTATSGTLTFAPNESSKTIAVPILGDTVAEPDETFTVTLSNPTNATLGVSQALALIQNDDVVVGASACTPRPRVTQTMATGGGALNVRVEATPLNTQQNNPLQQIRFGTFQNATVTLNGQTVTSGQLVTIPANTVAADFTVRRVTAGQATTVPMTVVDGCGAWDTFVGGGTAAAF